MLQFSTLLPSKNLLDILEICTPEGYSKREMSGYSLIHSPVTLLGFIKMHEQYVSLSELINILSEHFKTSKYKSQDDKIFDMWFKMHLIDDGVVLFENFLKVKESLFLVNNFSDLANYIYLTGRDKVEQIQPEEWLNNSSYIKLHNTVYDSPKNFDTTLNIMSSNYSISEVINIMYMSKESKYKLFIDEEINLSSSINSISLNNVVYQMLMIYYYYVMKEIVRPDKNRCLRLKEFASFETRQLLYSIIYDLSFMGNPDFYYELSDLNSDEVYHVMDENIVGKFFILVASDLPISEWSNLMSLPTNWIRSMVKYND